MGIAISGTSQISVLHMVHDLVQIIGTFNQPFFNNNISLRSGGKSTQEHEQSYQNKHINRIRGTSHFAP
jgi:hypothetical protein